MRLSSFSLSFLVFRKSVFNGLLDPQTWMGKAANWGSVGSFFRRILYPFLPKYEMPPSFCLLSFNRRVSINKTNSMVAGIQERREHLIKVNMMYKDYRMRTKDLRSRLYKTQVTLSLSL